MLVRVVGCTGYHDLAYFHLDTFLFVYFHPFSPHKINNPDFSRGRSSLNRGSHLHAACCMSTPCLQLPQSPDISSSGNELLQHTSCKHLKESYGQLDRRCYPRTYAANNYLESPLVRSVQPDNVHIIKVEAIVMTAIPHLNPTIVPSSPSRYCLPFTCSSPSLYVEMAPTRTSRLTNIPDIPFIPFRDSDRNTFCFE
jgi:hypothetical protein